MKELKALNKYLARYKSGIILGAFFVTISNIFGVYPAQVVRHSFDLVRENILFYKMSGGLALEGFVYKQFGQVLLIFAILVIGLAILKGIFMFMMRQTIIVMSRKVEFDLKNDIYSHFQDLSTSFYRRNNTGDLMARISEDVSHVRMYIGPAIMYSINLVTLIILVVAIMLSVNTKLTLYVLMPLPILAASIYFVNQIIQKKSMVIQVQLARITTFVQEMFSGIRVVKAFASEKNINSHFEVECEDYKEKSMSLVRVNSMFFPVILLLIGLSTLLTLYVGGREVMTGDITAGNLAEFFIYVNLLAWPVASIGWVTSIIQRASASQRRINELMEVKPEITSRLNKKIDLRGNIVFDDVSFVYPDTGIKAINNISFRVRQGETLGVIGRTGSGKSTLAALLFRLYDATSGKIFFEGEEIKDLDPAHFRGQIGYVPQDDFLFSDSIANNILFGCNSQEIKDKNPEEIADLLEKVTAVSDVKNDIIEFPKKYETRLGERGITLSGGQKQRVSIARAIIGNPDIMIFDDCFSAVDTHTEARILENLSSFMKKKTSIIISHRVSTVKNANHIIVLDEGRIIEEGKHDDLLENQGYYYKLYEKQMLEKELYKNL